jgi:hypothetical protein
VSVGAEVRTRDAELEQHGRCYGELRLAITFTAGLHGEDAKRVTARGWDKTRPLAHPEQGAAILRTRGQHANPAIVLRPSRMVGVDIDGPSGIALAKRYVPEGLPRTVTVETGKDSGFHVWYRAPEGPSTAFVELGASGVTAKRNQYMVGPPAIHPSGRVYRFAEGRAPWEQKLAVLPLELLELLERAAHGARERRTITTGPIAAGGRHDHLMRLGCAMRRHGCGETTISAALLAENLDRCRPAQDEKLVLALARDIATRYPPGTAQ